MTMDRICRWQDEVRRNGIEKCFRVIESEVVSAADDDVASLIGDLRLFTGSNMLKASDALRMRVLIEGAMSRQASDEPIQTPRLLKLREKRQHSETELAVAERGAGELALVETECEKLRIRESELRRRFDELQNQLASLEGADE